MILSLKATYFKTAYLSVPFEFILQSTKPTAHERVILNRMVVLLSLCTDQNRSIDRLDSISVWQQLRNWWVRSNAVRLL